MTYGQTDNVRGVIIGNQLFKWRLIYEGRSQGEGFAENHEIGLIDAISLRNQLKTDNPYIFMSASWDVQLFN